MKSAKSTTVVTFSDMEKPDYKNAAAAGVLAIESQIASLDPLCHWEITDAGEAIAYRAIREQRQALLTHKAKLHDFVVVLA